MEEGLRNDFATQLFFLLVSAASACSNMSVQGCLRVLANVPLSRKLVAENKDHAS